MKSCVRIDIFSFGGGGGLYAFPAWRPVPRPAPGSYAQCKDELDNCIVCRLYCVQAVHCQYLCQCNIIYNVEDSLSPPTSPVFSPPNSFHFLTSTMKRHANNAAPLCFCNAGLFFFSVGTQSGYICKRFGFFFPLTIKLWSAVKGCAKWTHLKMTASCRRMGLSKLSEQCGQMCGC